MSRQRLANAPVHRGRKARSGLCRPVSRRGRAVLGCAVLVALLAGCRSGKAVEQTLTVHVRGNPNRSSTAARCVFLIQAEVTEGGTQTTCLEEVRGVPYPNAVEPARGTMTFHLPKGTLETTVQVTLTFQTDGRHATQALTGTVTGATGAYAGMTGTIRGTGTVVDQASGLGPVDLTYTFTLHSR